MRLIVIGAGLGGPCLARGLRQEGIDVAVHERDTGPTARFQGWRIGLRAESIDTLRWCLPGRLHALLDATSGDALGEGRLFDRNVLRHLLLHDTAVRFDGKLDARWSPARTRRRPWRCCWS